MRSRDSISQDLVAGLLFVGFGLFSLYMASDYRVGSAVRMGPGYFPTAVGWSIVALGTLVAGRGLRKKGQTIERVSLRPLGCVVGAIVLFGLLIDEIGLVLSTLLLVVVARLGGHDYLKIKEISLQYIALILAIAALFIFALRLPIPLWPA